MLMSATKVRTSLLEITLALLDILGQNALWDICVTLTRLPSKFKAFISVENLRHSILKEQFCTASITLPDSFTLT
jgi:hypothetical protein